MRRVHAAELITITALTEPTEPTDPTEPTERTERTEPAERTERTERANRASERNCVSFHSCVSFRVTAEAARLVGRWARGVLYWVALALLT